MLGGHAGEQRRRHERGDDQTIVARRVGQDVVAEQPPDLVASEPPPATLGGGDGCSQPVGVGVVGERDQRTAGRGASHQQVHRTRLLRVGERHGGERAVGRLLLDHERRCGQPGAFERSEQRGTAHPVQRGVRHLHALRVGAQPHTRHRSEVRLHLLLAEMMDERVVDRRQRDRARVDQVDRRGDVGVGRRHDLRARAEVHLVAVVGRRVVRGGDHHARGRVDLGDVPRQHGRGHRVVEEHRLHTLRRADAGRVEREHVALATGVVADDHPAGGRVGHLREEVVDETGCGLLHDEPVHALRPGTHRGP